MIIDKILIDSFVKTTERAAYGASIFNGKNDKIAADQAAVDEMRKELNKIEMKGKIVIGEGEMDEAPMLYINEEVGTKTGEKLKALKGVNCMDCFEIMRNDEHSSRNKNYCRECLQ